MSKKTTSDAFEPSIGWRARLALVAAAAVFVLDCITKSIVRNTIAISGESVSFLPSILSFRYVENIGAAFSMGEGHGIAFAALACVVTIAIVVYLARASVVSKAEVLGLGLLAGGAIGNAADRVVLGYVVDFIATDFMDFPVFNVADIGICVGVVLAFLGFMFWSPAAKERDE